MTDPVSGTGVGVLLVSPAGMMPVPHPVVERMGGHAAIIRSMGIAVPEAICIREVDGQRVGLVVDKALCTELLPHYQAGEKASELPIHLHPILFANANEKDGEEYPVAMAAYVCGVTGSGEYISTTAEAVGAYIREHLDPSPEVLRGTITIATSFLQRLDREFEGDPPVDGDLPFLH